MKQLIIAILLITVATACNVTKRLPPGEKLYTGAKVKIENKDLKKKKRKVVASDLESFIRPKLNKSILGIRYKLWLYQIAGEPKKKKGIRNWLRNKVGEPPVLASSINLQRNVELISNRLENKGYFKAQATGDTISKHKKVEAVYTAKPGVRYTIRKVILPDDSTSIIEQSMTVASRRTLLKKDDPYDLDVIVAERERIDMFLKTKGFYFFNPNYLLMRVDSTVGANKVDIFVDIKDETPSQALKRYYIDDIYIYPDFALGQDTSKMDTALLRYKDFYVIDPKKKFKPQVFDRTMTFHKGEVYNKADHNLTLNRLVNIGTFKFVKNRFEVSPSVNDTSKLDAFYYLTPLKGKSLRTELTGKTTSAGFNGTELELSWRNRNTFRGAELLTIKATSGFDFQVSRVNKGYNIFRVGGEMNLVWPRIVPINFRSNGASVPRTQLMLAYDWLERQKLYTLNTFRTSFGYIWKESERKEHELNPINVTYVNSTSVTPEYLEQIRIDSTLARVIEKQLIIGPTYSFTYTNTARENRRNGIFYNGRLDLSGNLIGLAQGAHAKEGDYKSIWNVRYSQYVKTEQDFRYYLKLSGPAPNQWANRVYIGAGFPYGNSRELPFIKQFYSGGTNSLRGFRARTVGPGTYRPVVDPKSFYPDQTGDIKLEFNSELRFKIVSIVNGAVFADAGNIWLKNDNDYKPGAKFSSSWAKELAADAGIGLRFDLNILVLRTDFAIPVRKPWLPENERWEFFSRKKWLKDNLVFNLAIGLPF
ncbi:BamA/TamA family outer membrane protein [soil metagenome]